MNEVWQECQPFAMHPIQRQGLDEGLRKLLSYLNRPDLHELWMRQYG